MHATIRPVQFVLRITSKKAAFSVSMRDLSRRTVFHVAGFEVPLEMSVKLPGSETWSFHGISCLPLNFKDDFCSLLLTFKLGRLNKLTGKELFARSHKILSSNLLMIPQTTQKRILNFWFPKNRGEDSGFLTPKQHWRFRIPDPPNNTGEDSEFLTPD